jgi:hypothetical protein
MRASIILVCVAILFGLSGTDVRSFGQSLSQTTSLTTQHAVKRQGFFDYALGKINPQDKDYGAIIESRRNAVVENSIDDLYFWSNVATLTLLCVMAAIVLLQWRAADKREVIAASLIAQLWNGRVSDRIEIERRTAEFNQLVEAHNVQVERSLSQKPTSHDPQADEASKLTRSLRNLVRTGPKASSPEPQVANTTWAADASVTSLQQDNLLLQRRVEALQNSEQNLKQRLNQATVLLDQERRRNTTLKGA